MKQSYVVGFLYNSNKTQVILVKKTKPKWQKSRLNGIGGKVELNENSTAAMVREFREGTGVITNTTDWTPFCNYYWEEGFVKFFYAVNESYFIKVRTTTGEEVGPYYLSDIINHGHIYNLNWLIPLSLDPSLNFSKNGTIQVCE